MSDLLGRIIGRAKGAPSRVEPLLASRHERPVSFFTGLLSEPIAAPATAETRAAKRVAPRKQTIARAAPSVESVGRKPMRTRIASKPALLQPSNVLGAEVKLSETQRRESVLEGAPLAAQHEILRPQPQQTSELAVASITSSREEQPAATHPAEAPAGVSRASTPERPSTETNRARNIGMEVVTPAEVHVTIGHVELRMAAPPPATQARRTQPRVTLDDYLQRRNGGER